MYIEYPRNIPNIKENQEGWLDYSNKIMIEFYIYTIKKEKKKIKVLELGSYKGLSANYICSLIDNNDRLYCVDIWTGGYTITKKMSPNEKKNLEDNMLNQFIRNTWDNRSKISINMGDGIEELIKFHSKGIHFDVIYLDMDHEYKRVFRDLKYVTGLYPKSIIIGDDLLFHEGVSHAVYDIIKSNTLYSVTLYKNVFILDPHFIKNKILLNFSYSIDYNFIKKPILIILYNTKYINSDTKSFFKKIHKNNPSVVYINFFERNVFENEFCLNDGLLMNSIIDFNIKNKGVKSILIFNCLFSVKDEALFFKTLFYETKTILVFDKKITDVTTFLLNANLFKNGFCFETHLFFSSSGKYRNNIYLYIKTLTDFINEKEFYPSETILHMNKSNNETWNKKHKHFQKPKSLIIQTSRIKHLFNFYYEISKDYNTYLKFKYIIPYYNINKINPLIFSYYPLQNVSHIDNRSVIQKILDLKQYLFDSSKFSDYLYKSHRPFFWEVLYREIFRKYHIEITFLQLFFIISKEENELHAFDKKRVLEINNHFFDVSKNIENNIFRTTLNKIFNIKEVNLFTIFEKYSLDLIKRELFEMELDILIWYPWDFLKPNVNWKVITHYINDLDLCLNNRSLKLGGNLIMHNFNIFDMDENELDSLLNVMKYFSSIKLVKMPYPMGHKKIFYIILINFSGKKNHSSSLDISNFLREYIQMQEDIFFFDYNFQNFLWKIKDNLETKVFEKIIQSMNPYFS